MIDRLKEMERQFVIIESELSSPDVIAKQEEYQKLVREYSRLAPVISKYREYTKVEAAMRDAEDLSRDKSDAELRELAEAELEACEEKLAVLKSQLLTMLLPRDPNDDKNVIVEIRGGAGGDEAALFSAVLYRMYSMYAVNHNYKSEIISANETELGGFKEISFMIEGNGAYSRLKYESGVHRVQRVPETESSGRIHTSTVTVAVLPEAEEVEVEINPADLKIETIKSSGAGGQHVNKTESAIRLVHIPSGIVVECQDERSQFKNRDKAMKLLRTRLYDMKQSEQDEKIASERRSQVGTGDRSEKIRTYNYPQSRVTDHRIGKSIHDLEGFLNGDVDDMIDALTEYDNKKKIETNG